MADGAFNEGLQLPTNGWVQVDYLWTAEYRARAEITTATPRRRGGRFSMSMSAPRSVRPGRICVPAIVRSRPCASLRPGLAGRRTTGADGCGAGSAVAFRRHHLWLTSRSGTPED